MSTERPACDIHQTRHHIPDFTSFAPECGILAGCLSDHYFGESPKLVLNFVLDMVLVEVSPQSSN